jgi:hypothetical protein
LLTKEQHTKILNDLRSMCTDIGKASEILTELSDDYSSTLACVDDLTNKNAEFHKNNESLVKANGNLFLKLQMQEENKEEEKEEEKPLTFDSLFDEKGNLKQI